MRENVSGAVNQQGSRLIGDPSETTRRAPSQTQSVVEHYFLGALHDGTRAKLHKSVRIAQKGTEWLTVLQQLLREIGYGSWIYQEGKRRDVFILETYAPFLRYDLEPHSICSLTDKIAYVRGFFDAEGGMPRQSKSRFYIQLVQKDKGKLALIKCWLQELGITVGVIHNPSRRVDPDYWRMFVRANSWQKFMRTIGSWHPRKQAIFKTRMVI